MRISTMRSLYPLGWLFKKKKASFVKELDNLELCITGGNAKWYSQLWKTLWQFLKKLSKIII